MKELKKSKMAQIIGGTSTTTMKEVGLTENEYWDWDTDFEHPIVIEIPDENSGK